MVRDWGIGLLPGEVAVSDAGEVFDLRDRYAGAVDDVVDLVALAGMGEITPIAGRIGNLIAGGKREGDL